MGDTLALVLGILLLVIAGASIIIILLGHKNWFAITITSFSAAHGIIFILVGKSNLLEFAKSLIGMCYLCLPI